MKNKLSMFNYYFNLQNESNNGFYIFNTRTRKLILFRNGCDASSINNSYLKNIDDISISLLREYGMIVDNDENEIEDLECDTINKVFDPRKLFLTIIPTSDCNFRCVYCYQENNGDTMTEDTLNNILRWLDKNLRFFNELNLSWFGGEPLLCSAFMIKAMERIKLLCAKHKVAMVSSVTTNGYLLDIETFKSLVENRLLFYQITIDGNKETHNQLRPHKSRNDSYDKIIDNLTAIAQLPKKYRFEIGIRINVAGIMKKNDISNFIDNMTQIFGNDKRFVIIWQWVRNWGGERLNSTNANIFVRQSQDCIKYADQAIQKGLYCADLISITSGTDTCEAFYKNGYVINFDGCVYKCAMHLEDKENNCIGEILKNGEMKLDEKKVRRWHKQDEIQLRCSKCIYLPMCLITRCHYRTKIHNKLKCFEYKDLVEQQIQTMVKAKLYRVLEVK